ncbi:crotonase [Niveomyces insectorum RCEF 264]|uniref:3-hydroxyisobutyryl-CoA hydrolase n=1 Tax=Niveomyces insectorum RCEF 264 TaxID=1081102 RepID=A0A162LCR3_9HYPO|nr:crotonase [Niveomyces insectorum RCEF 264]
MLSKSFLCRAGPAATAAAATSASKAVARRSFATAALAAGLRQTTRTMPLRAKILAPVQLSLRANMSNATNTSDTLWKPQAGDEPEDVLFGNLYGLRTIILNRPAKYNSLNASMIRKIGPRLQAWETSDMANVVVLKGAGDKALCAGGDVTALAEANMRGPEGQAWSADYFALEYKLDHLIATYEKPYVAFMDGITMGGGVGLSIHAPFRIATERTVFAMPETNIGFFPDVGASFFLPRMPGAVGTYLALTSERLTGVNAFYAGVATHYLHSTSLPALEARLAELRFKDTDERDARLDIVNATIEEFVTGLPHDQPMQLAGDVRRAIDRCFGHNSVAAIVAALEAEAAGTGTGTGNSNEATKAWATKTLATLQNRSPTSVHVALRLMRVGREWTITEAFQREHQIAARFMRHPDFTEGVSFLLIRKEKQGRPQWQPPTLADVDPSGAITEPFFVPAGASPEDPEPLQMLNTRGYSEYPHARLGVPSEDVVEALVRSGTKTQREVVNELVGKTRGKQGVKEVVEEIVARKTTKDERGKAVWVDEP